MPVATTTLDQIATNILQRIQDDTGIFWSRPNEATVAAAEAVNDLLLLVGRPTQVTDQIITLTPNTVWQTIPAGMFVLTDVRGDNFSMRKVSLRAMDYTQASWGSDWTADRDDVPQRWGPIGFSSWFVHPAPTTPIQVTVAGIAIPVPSAWPFDPATQSPFHSELDVALELYGAAYCRLKDLGVDQQEGNALRQQYLSLAQQLTQIEDRRDPVIFSQTLGVPTAVSQLSLR